MLTPKAFLAQVISADLQPLIASWTSRGFEVSIYKSIEQSQLRGPDKQDSRTGFYLKLVSYLKDFINSNNGEGVTQFLFGCLTKTRERLNNQRVSSILSTFVSRLDFWRRETKEIQLIVYLLTCPAPIPLTKCYLKLRASCLKYAAEELLFQYDKLSNHNLNKYSRKCHEMLEGAKIRVETWAVMAEKLLQGTEFLSPMNIEKVTKLLHINLKSLDDITYKSPGLDLVVVLLYIDSEKTVLLQPNSTQSSPHRQKLEKGMQVSLVESIANQLESPKRKSYDSEPIQRLTTKTKVDYSYLKKQQNKDAVFL